MKKNALLKFVSLAVLVALTAAMLAIPAAAAPTAVPTGSRLKSIAGSLLIGYAAATNFNSRSDSATYKSVASSEFNWVTPENAMKWDATEATQGSFTFSNADALVSFAQTNVQKIHGHTLVWHSQLPSWVSSISGSTNMTNVMNSHIDGVMNHWSDGTIYAWDVVNEAFNDDGTRRSSPFQNQIGNTFIEKAFQRARADDSMAKLIYNDYNVETVNSKSNAMYSMVQDFKSRGIPIDGVGFQMHLTESGLDYNSLATNMARFAALGVDIYITEMDVRLNTPVNSGQLTTQATIYQSVLDKCMLQARCKGFQVWGIPDKDSWVMSTFPGTGSALIFDDNYNAKPAYYSIQSRLGGGGGATSTPTRTPTLTGPTPTKTNTPIPSGNFLTNADMESGTTNWVVNGAGTLSSDTTQHHGGTKSIKITGRTAAWNGIGQNVALSNFSTSGQNYTVSVWVRSQTGTPTAKATVRLTAGTTTYVTLASAAINSTGWTQLTGTVPVSWSGTLTGVLFYVETAAGTDNLYMDDASLHK